MNIGSKQKGSTGVEYLISQEIINLIFKEFTYSEAKLLIILIGNREGFLLSQKFLENCGLSESSYKSARKSLVDAGMIEYNPYCSIGINYPALYKKAGIFVANEHKPKIDEISKYITENGLKVDAKKFFDYYERNCWKTKNGVEVHNWQKKINEWEKRLKPKNSNEKPEETQKLHEDKYDWENGTLSYWSEENLCYIKHRLNEEEINLHHRNIKNNTKGAK